MITNDECVRLLSRIKDIKQQAVERGSVLPIRYTVFRYAAMDLADELLRLNLDTDITASLREAGHDEHGHFHTTLRLLNTVAEALRAVPQEHIAQMTAAQRRLVASWMNEQQQRYEMWEEREGRG